MPADLKRVIVSGGLVLFASTLVSATAASQRRAVSPLDFLTTREASSPQISPDGQTVVFVLEEPGPRKDGQPWRGDQDLWRVPADGSAPPQRWIASPKRDWSPRWSPDGGSLAFLSKRGQGESNGSTTQIFLSDSSGAEVRQLTRVGGEISAFRWAADGSRIHHPRDSVFFRRDGVLQHFRREPGIMCNWHGSHGRYREGRADGKGK